MDAMGTSPTGRGEAEIRDGYAALGYELLFPENVLEASRDELERVAMGVTRILDAVYHRDLALSAERTLQLVDDVVSGRVLLFVLLDRDMVVVATTAFTKVEPVFPDSQVSSYEAGRTAKRLGAPPRLATDFLRASTIWAAGNLGGSDYLVAHARVAQAQAGRPFNGRILARFVGLDHFLPTHAVYSHYVAQTAAEPFVWCCAPINPESWRNSVRQQQIHLPDGAEARMLEAMLSESFEIQVFHHGSVHDQPSVRPGAVRELARPSPTIESLYVLTGHPPPSRWALDEIPSIIRPNGVRASAGLSDRVIVEEDIISRADSVHVLSTLRRQGFDFAGWTPSGYQYGRLALVLTRPGPVPGEAAFVASPDLSALAHLPAAHRFLTQVLSRRPWPEPPIADFTL